MRTQQNGEHFANDIFKDVLLGENHYILISILLEFVPRIQMRIS